MEDFGFYDVFQGTSWGRDPDLEFAMLLHDHQSLPEGVSAHVIVKTPAVHVDSVTPDYFASFHILGEYLRHNSEGPIYFLGNTTVPSFARLQGLEVGLGGKDR